MQKVTLGLIIFCSAGAILFVLFSTVFTEPFVTDVDEYDIFHVENASFVGLSGDGGNAVVLFVNNACYHDVVLDFVNITCASWERQFVVDSTYKNLPVGGFVRVVLDDVGWVEGQSYMVCVFSSIGHFSGWTRITA
ncbi:MAG: hypothetical protein AC479_02925 [miscellaneous Crenarchaeota group-6 archaeon AD8-1]|nr:MAG: hypothetical protein AC479_02925 [miscellaneous Crenarchaeota group-6 archaeon AD8-1]